MHIVKDVLNFGFEKNSELKFRDPKTLRIVIPNTSVYIIQNNSKHKPCLTALFDISKPLTMSADVLASKEGSDKFVRKLGGDFEAEMGEVLSSVGEHVSQADDAAAQVRADRGHERGLVTHLIHC